MRYQNNTAPAQSLEHRDRARQSGRERFRGHRVVPLLPVERALMREGPASIAMENNGMHLFCLYNWSYAMRLVMAPDKDTAKQIAIAAGHVRNGQFRRITQLTPESDQFTPEQAASLREKLATQKTPGCTEYDAATNAWVVRSRL